MSIKALKSISFLWVGTLIGSGSSFLIFSLLGKNYGPNEFGEFTSSLSIVSLFVLVAGFGVSKFWLKIFGESGWNSLIWIKPSLVFISITTTISFILLFTWSFFGNHSVNTKLILQILSLFLVSQILVELVSSKFQLEERYQRLAIWQFTPNLLRLLVIGSIIIFIKPIPSIIYIAFVFSIVSIFIIILSVIELLKINFRDLQLKGHTKSIEEVNTNTSLKTIFNETVPFGIGAIFAFIYVQVDVIMLKYMVSSTEAGIYFAAYTILAAIYTIPNVLFNKFLLPKIHRWAVNDRKKFRETYVKGNFLMLAMGILTFLFLFFSSKYIITFVFGVDFNDSINLLKILAFTLPFFLMAYSTSATLVTQNHMIKKAFIMFLVALFNVILNFLLIPNFGSIGAAIATIASNALLLSLYFYANYKYVFKATIQ